MEHALHVFGQCPSVKDRLRERGWTGPPEGATDYQHLYRGSLGWDALTFVEDVVGVVEAWLVAFL